MNRIVSDGFGADEIATLTAKAHARQWSPDLAIDWCLPIARPRWLSYRAYVSALSQLRHAEQATLDACVRLRTRLIEPAAMAFLAVQIVDEQRHVAVYDRYLAALGDRAPADAALSRALDGALNWTGPPIGLMVAFHLLLEVEAVKLHGDFSRWFPCRLLRAINLPIARDEARHVAFGKLYLRERLVALAAEERRDIYRWVRDLWHQCIDLDPDNGGRFMRRIRRDYMTLRWAQHRRTLVEIGLIGAGSPPARVA